MTRRAVVVRDETRLATIGEVKPETRHHAMMIALAPVKVLAFTWVGVVVLAILAYTLTASSPALGDTSWRDSARMGASIWALALGAPLKLPDAEMSLMPLSLTLIIVCLVYRALRSVGVLDWRDAGVASVSAFLTTAILGFSAHSGTSRLLCALMSALVTAFAAVVGMQREWPDTRAWNVLRSAAPTFKLILLGLAAAAVLMLAAALLFGHSRIGVIYGYYVVGAAGAVMLTLVQLLYLPGILVWALAYATGAGFAVGEGTDFSALGSQTLPLPAIPVFGALPSATVTAVWIPVVLAVLSLCLGVYRSRRYAPGEAAAHALAVAGFLFLGALVAGWLASGSIGPGRMAEVGPSPLPFAVAVALEIGCPFAVGLLARHGRRREGKSPQDGESEGRSSQEEGIARQGDGILEEEADGRDVAGER